MPSMKRWVSYTTRKICFYLLVTQSVFVHKLTFAGRGKLKDALSDSRDLKKNPFVIFIASLDIA